MAKEAVAGRARPGVKPRLDPEMIISAGLEVAASSRSLRLSAKELGARLEADPTAIYRHFRNKGHLMEALLDELEMRAVRAVTAPREQWQDRLRQLAGAVREEYCAHPAVAAEAMALTTHGPGEQSTMELMLDAFTCAGLPAEEVVRHYALFSAHVLSQSAGMARVRATLRPDEDPEHTPWVEGDIHADPFVYPRIAEFSAQLAELEDIELFMLGVDALIQSAEAAAARVSA